jgi:hypothetical protein
MGLIQGFVFPRLELYGLSHASSPFFSGYFGDKFSLFAQVSLDCNPFLFLFIYFFNSYVHTMFGSISPPFQSSFFRLPATTPSFY